MSTAAGGPSPNRTARLAAALYVLMIPLGLLGIMYVPTALVVAGDAAATSANIMANQGMFRLSIATALVVQVTHIFIVLLLYQLLKPVGKALAALMVVFMLVSVPITMLNELNHFAVLLVLSGADFLKVFPADQLKAMVPLFFALHDFVINSIAGIFWGLWLLPMGILVYRSGFMSKIPGVLLLVAGSAYVVDSFAKTLWTGYADSILATIVMVALFGEIVFPVWLLITGVDVEAWKQRALESA
jgi:hypothetical protein